MSVEAEWLVEKCGEDKTSIIIKDCKEDPAKIDYYAILNFEPYDKNRQTFRICVRSVLKELYETAPQLDEPIQPSSQGLQAGVP